MTNTTRISLPIAAVAFAAGSATAAVITPVSAVAPPSSFGTPISQTIDGSGLTGLTHASSVPDNSYATDISFLPAGLPLVVDFDLGGTFPVDGLNFWNQNDGGPGAAGSTGLQDVRLSASTNGVTYTPIPGAPSLFFQEPGPTSAAQTFSFAPVNAAFIRLEAFSNYGDISIGFAEINFIPTPGAATLLGLGGIAALRRRRRIA